MFAQHAAQDKHCCADDVSSKKEFHYLLSFLGSSWAESTTLGHFTTDISCFPQVRAVISIIFAVSEGVLDPDVLIPGCADSKSILFQVL